MSCSTMFIKLVVAYNKEWEVFYQHKPKSYIQLQGWYGFIQDNGLAEGDICVFERVGRDEDIKRMVNCKRRRD